MSDYRSRSEKILQSIIDGTEYTEEPLTRIEKLLLQLGPGGGSCTPGNVDIDDDGTAESIIESSDVSEIVNNMFIS